MRFFVCLIIFACLACPVFSQNANEDRYQALSDSIDFTLETSRSNLEDFDQDLQDSGSNNSYASYRGKYRSIVRRMGETEERIDLLTRTNDKTSLIRRERDRYENLINELEQVQSDYNSWKSNRK